MRIVPGLQSDLPQRADRPIEPVESVVLQRALVRILAFTGRTIDDVVNDPVAKGEVWGYFKLMKQIERGSEVVELERWWNSPLRP